MITAPNAFRVAFLRAFPEDRLTKFSVFPRLEIDSSYTLVIVCDRESTAIVFQNLSKITIAALTLANIKHVEIYNGDRLENIRVESLQILDPDIAPLSEGVLDLALKHQQAALHQ